MPYFEKEASDRAHNFWLCDPMAILIDSRAKAEQRLDYIHYNPLQAHWNLAQSPEDYRWSSASFYMTGIDEFAILTHYLDRF